MNLNSNNETKKISREINIETANKKICNEDNFKLSQKNLITMYSYLYLFIHQNLTGNLETYLNKTSYFNKIIFLKYLNFFINLNKFRARFLDDINNQISKLEKKIEAFRQQIEELREQIEQLDQEQIEAEQVLEEENADISAYEKKIQEIEEERENIEEEKNNIQEKIQKFQKLIETHNTKKINIDTIKQEFMVNTTNILIENTEATSIIETLFDANVVNKMYTNVITHINNNRDDSFNEYKTLFHLNPIDENSSEKAIFYIGVHGTLYVVVPNNTYLTIKTPIDTIINRWGERGEVIKYFSSMDYTFKQCLLEFGENLNEFKADTCFEMLGTDIEEFNMHTRQTTPAYCVKEPDNPFSNLTDFKQNTKMRIKHYSVDNFDYMIFNTDYTIPDDLFSKLSHKIPPLQIEQLQIPQLNNLQYNTAENIINLNFLLFTNNINFTVFDELNIHDETRVNKFGLYSDIGLYARYYIQKDNRYLQSDLLNFYFPLDIFSFDPKPNLYIEDFTLEREIYALNDINIRLTYQDVDRSFKLFKGDSFSCNPYIIEYFIKTFNSKITIRPGPILGNKADSIFEQNKQEPTTTEKGATITCLSKGLSCYKVTLSALTNYEILQFCKDANIETCDLYDTSCQSFEFIDKDGQPAIQDGQPIPNYTPPEQQKQTLKRMNTNNDSTMLSTYDNLSDIMFNSKRHFQVVGVEVEEKRKKTGGKTQKRINRKKNSRKQSKNSKKNSRKQSKNSRKQSKNSKKNSRKQKTKKIYK